MALFGRRKKDDVPGRRPVDADPSLPALSRADAAELDRLTRQTFASRGVEVTSDGAGTLLAMDGRTYGLTNLAAGLAGAPRSSWPELVGEHVDLMLTAHEVPPPQTLEEVRDRVYPRLRMAADLPERPAYAAEVLPGVVALLAVDHPTHVAEVLADDVVSRLGVAEVEAQWLVNLRGLPTPDHQVLTGEEGRDDSLVHLLVSDDFFAPSRLLVLDDVLARVGVPPSPHGTLVAVPNRHLLVVHPVTGPGVVPAMQVLVAIARGECDHQPGPISPHVYFLPADGAVPEQVDRLDDDGSVVVQVQGALAAAFEALDWPEGPASAG